MANLAGIDLGTSSLKVLIVDETGATRAFAARDYSFFSPVNGWAEQGADDWWRACCECLQRAVGQLPPGERVDGVSFSGQMHGVVLLDGELREVRPAILHCDARSGRQVRRVEETLGRERVAQLLMNPVYTGFMMPSLLWVRDEEPALFERVRHVMLPKDYIKLKLSGRICSDFADASATLAFDLGKQSWSQEILDAVDLPRTLFPDCDATTAVIGTVTAEAAQATGLPVGTPVVNGGGDQVMQAIGNGVTEPGQATVNIGTSGQVCFQSDHLVRNPVLNTNTFCGYEPGRWITMGATMSAGLSLKWFDSLFETRDYKKLDETVARIAPGSGGLLYLPYLMGERTPHINPDLSGMLLGLQTNSGRYELSRAVMEGVCYSLRQAMEVCGELGLHCDTFVASGGGARSKPWLQMQADVYNVALKVADVDEHACLGAAIAAGAGVGIFGSVRDGCERTVCYKPDVYRPDPKRHEVYNEYYRLYKEAYTAIRPVLEQVTALGRAGA